MGVAFRSAFDGRLGVVQLVKNESSHTIPFSVTTGI